MQEMAELAGIPHRRAMIGKGVVEPTISDALFHLEIIQLDQSQKAVVKVLDLTGKTILERAFTKNTSINLGHIPPQVLLFEIRIDNEVFVHRVILF
ncbi:MAG: hypothetical protein AAFU60_06040 [Bacteroidota bacterium]